jgi:hypothetical protein
VLHIKQIIAAFRETLLRVKSLDFSSPVTTVLGVEHEVLSLLSQWYRGERQRIGQLRHAISSLPKLSTLHEQPQSTGGNSEFEALRAGLLEAKRLLRLHHDDNHENKSDRL